jgi:hypothetical protein
VGADVSKSEKRPINVEHTKRTAFEFNDYPASRRKLEDLAHDMAAHAILLR